MLIHWFVPAVKRSRTRENNPLVEGGRESP